MFINRTVFSLTVGLLTLVVFPACDHSVQTDEESPQVTGDLEGSSVTKGNVGEYTPTSDVDDSGEAPDVPWSVHMKLDSVDRYAYLSVNLTSKTSYVVFFDSSQVETSRLVIDYELTEPMLDPDFTNQKIDSLYYFYPAQDSQISNGRLLVLFSPGLLCAFDSKTTTLLTAEQYFDLGIFQGPGLGQLRSDSTSSLALITNYDIPLFVLDFDQDPIKKTNLNSILSDLAVGGFFGFKTFEWLGQKQLILRFVEADKIWDEPQVTLSKEELVESLKAQYPSEYLDITCAWGGPTWGCFGLKSVTTYLYEDGNLDVYSE